MSFCCPLVVRTSKREAVNEYDVTRQLGNVCAFDAQSYDAHLCSSTFQLLTFHNFAVRPQADHTANPCHLVDKACVERRSAFHTLQHLST